MRFGATIKDGKLRLHDLQYFQHFVATNSGDYVLVFKKGKETRSDRQNRFYWAILREIEQQTGSSSSDLHEFFKKKFNTKLVKVKDEVCEVGGSTTELGTGDFKKYLDEVKLYTLYEFGITILDPNEPPLV